MKVKTVKKVDWAQIMYNSLCSELDQWYKYVKGIKGQGHMSINPDVGKKNLTICLFTKRTIHKNHKLGSR